MGDDNSHMKYSSSAPSRNTLWNITLETVLICSCSEMHLMGCKDLLNSSCGSVSTSKQIIPLKISAFYLFLVQGFIL